RRGLDGRGVTGEVVPVLPEDVDPLWVERHRDILLRRHRRVGVAPELTRRASGLDREVEIRPDRLEELHNAGDPALSAGEAQPDVLWPKAEADLASRLDLVLELGRAEHLGRERHVDAVASEAPAAVDRLERPV